MIYLQDVIDALAILDGDKPVRLAYEAGGLPCVINPRNNIPSVCDCPGLDVMSYRGYYTDASIEPGVSLDYPTVDQLRGALEDAIGTAIHGYKGGTYVVDATRPLWCAGYGDATGDMIVGAEDRGGWVNLLIRRVQA